MKRCCSVLYRSGRPFPALWALYLFEGSIAGLFCRDAGSSVDFGMASAVTLDLTLCKTRIFEIGWIRQQHASKQEMHEFGRCTSASTREFVVHDSTAL